VLGILWAGALSDNNELVFYMLMASDVLALLFLIRLTINEIKSFRQKSSLLFSFLKENLRKSL
jgi:hypothetical protein